MTTDGSDGTAVLGAAAEGAAVAVASGVAGAALGGGGAGVPSAAAADTGQVLPWHFCSASVVCLTTAVAQLSELVALVRADPASRPLRTMSWASW